MFLFKHDLIIGRGKPETRRRKILIKNLDESKIVVIFPHIDLKNVLIVFGALGTISDEVEKNLKTTRNLSSRPMFAESSFIKHCNHYENT